MPDRGDKNRDEQRDDVTRGSGDERIRGIAGDEDEELDETEDIDEELEEDEEGSF